MFLQDVQKSILALSRSTVWSTAGRAKLLCRLTGRSTDMHQFANVHIGRPAWSTGRKSRALCLFRSTGPVDRQRVFTLCLGTSVDRPVDRFPNGRKSDRWRSTGSRKICYTGCQQLYSVLFFVGTSPNGSIGFSNLVFIPYK